MNSEDLLFLKMTTKPLILVWNKCDLAEKEPALSSQFKEEVKCLRGEVRISAKDTSGFAELYSSVKAVLTAGISTERTQAGLGSERQKTAVQEALESVNHALLTSKEDLALDAVVQDLEEALNSLGEVTGEVTADDVLGSIFSRFCVGK